MHEESPSGCLAANNTPDFRTISDFRKDHLSALSGLFLQVVLLCQQAGLVKLGHVALDGTKVRANASKHKAMSYKRMEKEAQLQGEVDELLRRAQEVDEEEDRRYGRDKRGDELPAELVGKAGWRGSVRPWRHWKPRPAPAGEQAAQEGKERSGVPEDAQRNFTDAEAVPGPTTARRWWTVGRSWRRGPPTRPRTQQAVVMIEEVIANVGAVPREVSADAGYYSAQRRGR